MVFGKLKTVISAKQITINISRVDDSQIDISVTIPSDIHEDDLRFHGVKIIDENPSKHINTTCSENTRTNNEQKKKRKLKEKFHREHPEIPVSKIDTSLEQPGTEIELGDLESVAKGKLIAKRELISNTENAKNQYVESESRYRWSIEAKYNIETNNKLAELRLSYDPDEAEKSNHKNPIESSEMFMVPDDFQNPEINASKEGNELKLSLGF